MNTAITKDPADMSLDELAAKIAADAKESAAPAPAPAVADTKSPNASLDQTSDPKGKSEPSVSGESGGDAFAMPDKFRGKSAEDIARAYVELEKHNGRVSSERMHTEREAAATRDRLIALEREFASRVPPPKEKDPLEGIEDELMLEPAKALRKVVDLVRSESRKSAEQMEYESNARATQSHYHKLKAENPDFAELEPEMVSLTATFGKFVDPRFLNTPEFIDRVYEIARGRNVSKYVKQAEDRLKSSRDLVKQEKRNAFSESSQSQGSPAEKPFEELSIDEMRKRLGVANRD